MGRHLGIDFSSILVDLGTQVGWPGVIAWRGRRDRRERRGVEGVKGVKGVNVGRDALTAWGVWGFALIKRGRPLRKLPPCVEDLLC